MIAKWGRPRQPDPPPTGGDAGGCHRVKAQNQEQCELRMDKNVECLEVFGDNWRQRRQGGRKF